MRDGYSLKDWWQIYFLFKRICSQDQLSKLINYKFQFAELVLKGQGKIGEKKEYKRLLADEKFRQDIMTQVKELSNNQQELDIAFEWSQFYPRVYKNVKPKMIDWDSERVFEQTLWNTKIETYDTYYKVVPNNIALFNETNNELLCLRDEDKILKPKCKEIKFAKRK